MARSPARVEPERRLLRFGALFQLEDTMFRLAVPLSILAAATLSACSAPPQQGGPAQPAAGPKVVTNVHPYKAGTGVVQAVMPAPSTAAAGGSAEPLQRLEIKMDSGGVQLVDTSSKEFKKGTRVQLTEDKQIKKM